jgi:hypothetical protein
MSLSLIIIGVVLLALGIILGHFFPSRYWIALIAVGIVLLIIGVILLVIPSFSLLILPCCATYGAHV